MYRSDPVVLTAPTGVAAFNIEGITCHSALKLPVEHCREYGQRRLKYTALGGEKLRDLRAKFRDTRYLIIDEVGLDQNYS